MLVVLEQFIHQAHGPARIVSDRAVNDLDFQHTSLQSGLGDYIIEAIPAKTPALFRPQGAT
jgi:hypothetical protein